MAYLLMPAHDTLTTDQLIAAREWIADCQWEDIDDPSELSDSEVTRGIARHYDRGIAGFIRDSQPTK